MAGRGVSPDTLVSSTNKTAYFDPLVILFRPLWLSYFDPLVILFQPFGYSISTLWLLAPKDFIMQIIWLSNISLWCLPPLSTIF
jgi:hypothetical protein